MKTPWIILATIACYFTVLVLLSWTRGRRADNIAFFTGGRSSSWLMATLAMIGASISGVTFISVPGAVGTGGYAYMQMVLGFFVGAVVVAAVLIPLFYRMNLTSIYGYLEQRFGGTSCRTGAWIFFVSKMLGASVRFFVVCAVLQPLVFEPLHVPFAVGVVLTVALIWLYSFQGGVKSMIGTDVLKTLCLVTSVVCCIGCIAHSLNLNLTELPGTVASHPTSQVFFFDHPGDGRYFWKQFLAGIFLMIATTGLDQDLMQRTLSCRNPRDAQKNMLLSAFVQIFVIGLFLVLGTLLYVYADAQFSDKPINGDALFGRVVWSDGFPGWHGTYRHVVADGTGHCRILRAERRQRHQCSLHFGRLHVWSPAGYVRLRIGLSPNGPRPMGASRSTRLSPAVLRAAKPQRSLVRRLANQFRTTRHQRCSHLHRAAVHQQTPGTTH